MARQPTLEQLYEELLDRYGRVIADAFIAAMSDVATAADLQRIITAIEAGNLGAAIDAMNLDGAVHGPVLEAIRASYIESGHTTVARLPALKDSAGAKLVVRFDASNPRAERWLKEHSSELVTRINAEQREVIRSALRDGMERGEGPRTTALNVVGRLNRATGKREGGVIGLTVPQEAFVRNARDELASGSPDDLQRYLGRTRRDKRYDAAVKKAIASGEPIPAAIQQKALAQYKNRLIALRGEMLGRTEAMASLQAAKHQSYLQAVDEGKIAESAIRRVWRSAGDFRVRHTHRAMDRDAVGLRESFKSPSGALLMYPGDPSAPPGETVGCRCDVTYRIDHLANLMR